MLLKSVENYYFEAMPLRIWEDTHFKIEVSLKYQGSLRCLQGIIYHASYNSAMTKLCSKVISVHYIKLCKLSTNLQWLEFINLLG